MFRVYSKEFLAETSYGYVGTFESEKELANWIEQVNAELEQHGAIARFEMDDFELVDGTSDHLSPSVFSAWFVQDAKY